MQDESINLEHESQVLKLPSGKLGLKYKLPFSFQGHTFCMYIDKKDEPEGEFLGPYRIEFVLANEFLLHLAQHELSSIEIEEGYSNLFTRKLAKLKSLVLQYQLPDSTKRREAEAPSKPQRKAEFNVSSSLPLRRTSMLLFASRVSSQRLYSIPFASTGKCPSKCATSNSSPLSRIGSAVAT